MLETKGFLQFEIRNVLILLMRWLSDGHITERIKLGECVLLVHKRDNHTLVAILYLILALNESKSISVISQKQWFIKYFFAKRHLCPTRYRCFFVTCGRILGKSAEPQPINCNHKRNIKKLKIRYLASGRKTFFNSVIHHALRWLARGAMKALENTNWIFTQPWKWKLDRQPVIGLP